MVFSFLLFLRILFNTYACKIFVYSLLPLLGGFKQARSKVFDPGNLNSQLVRVEKNIAEKVVDQPQRQFFLPFSKENKT